MRRCVKIVAFFLVTLSVCSFGGIKLGSRMQYAIDHANLLSRSQPAPIWDMNVDYHGADILRFVDNEHLLVGSVTFDMAGKVKYGPVMLYDLRSRSQLWRIKRERNYASRYDIVGLQPNLVARTVYDGKIVHSAYALNSGRELWKNSMDEGSLFGYQYSSSFGLERLFVLVDGKLMSVDAISGKRQWSSAIASGGISGAPSRIVSIGSAVLVVGTKNIDAYDLQDGRHLWSRPNPVEKKCTVLADGQGFLVYGGTTLVHLDESGKMEERWRSESGEIKLIAPFKDRVFVVTRKRNGKQDMLYSVSSCQTEWAIPLPGRIMSPLLTVKDMLYVTTARQETERGDRAFHGISIWDKKISFSITLDNSTLRDQLEYVPLPDKLIARGKLILVVREQQGITAVSPKQEKIVWKQPVDSAVKEERLCLLNRAAPELQGKFATEAGSSYRANLRASQSTLNLQMKYRNLMQSTGSLTKNPTRLGNSASATSAGMHVDRSMAAAGTAIVAMNAAADISNAFWKAFPEIVGRRLNLAKRIEAILGIRIAEAQYRASISDNYYIPAPTETIIMVDLNTGNRADLTTTLSIPNLPGRLWPVALSPNESKMAVVGIGLDSGHYKRVTRAMLEVPKSSLIVYNIKDLCFVERRKGLIEPGGETAERAPGPAAPVVDAAYMIKAGYPPLVAYAMFGTTEDVRKAIASGEDVNAPYVPYGLTPLMAATYRGDIGIVKLLLDSGADVHAKNVFKKTAYDNLARVKNKAVRDEIRQLFDAAAKK